MTHKIAVTKLYSYHCPRCNEDYKSTYQFNEGPYCEHCLDIMHWEHVNRMAQMICGFYPPEQVEEARKGLGMQ
jgi:hypothetical protein